MEQGNENMALQGEQIMTNRINKDDRWNDDDDWHICTSCGGDVPKSHLDNRCAAGAYNTPVRKWRVILCDSEGSEYVIETTGESEAIVIEKLENVQEDKVIHVEEIELKQIPISSAAAQELELIDKVPGYRFHTDRLDYILKEYQIARIFAGGLLLEEL